MKEITKFQAEDGTEFNSESKCLAYEAVCKRVDEIMREFPPKPRLPGCGFENGGGYLQHDPTVVNQVRYKLLELANELYPHRWFTEAMEKEDAHPSYPARLIDEMGNKFLTEAWYRVYCTDSQYREWGQPYYRENPERAKQVRLN